MMSTATIIAKRLPDSRFGTYMTAAGGDQAKAVDLYRWNLELAAALFETLTLTEVFLRNALDAQLREWNGQQCDGFSDRLHSTEWTSDPARPLRSLTSEASKKAHQAAVKARAGRPANHPRKNAPISHDDVIAQLTFGVFVKLLPISDERNRNFGARKVLWREALINAFPHLGRRDLSGYATSGRADRLRALRNRVAHAEPLLSVDPRHRLRDAGRLLASIDPTTAGWVTGASRVVQVADLRPT